MRSCRWGPGLLIASFACAAGPSDAPGPSPGARAAEAANGVEAEARTDAPPPRAETTPRRGQVLGGEPVHRVIEWPPPDAIDRDVRAALGGEVVGAIDAAPGPVLAPADASWRADARCFSGDGWATLTGRNALAGAGFDLTVSTVARLVEGVTPFEGDRRLRGVDARVTQNEGIWSASWREHGAAYSLEVICDRPFEGVCRDDRAVVALVESLVYVGGRGANR